MKSYLNILFPFLLCFCTNSITANENPIGLQPALLEGDTTIMQQSGLQILSDCAGVILDPGGYGDYQNGIFSTITILPPSPADVTLFFPEFNVENTFDDFIIYDGPDASSPLIGIYDNMDLLGQTIVSSGGALTIVFDTDNSVVRSGFVIDYSVAGGSETPVANFEVSQTTPIPLNFPVSFTDLSENAGSWLYDFGDGTQSTEPNTTHAFATPGTYEVSLTISNCSNIDSYTQTVIVQESGQLEINPAETCVTLNSFMTTTVQVALTNTGVGDLYYNFTEISDENPNSLTVILGTGIIPPGGTQSVNLFFSAGDLVGGTYDFDLLLETGDISQPELIYPVKMIVVGIPLISIAPNSLAFPEGYLGTPQVDSICVINLGTDTLRVTNITLSTTGFGISPTEFNVPPGGEAKFNVSLLAEEVGIFAGVISIFSNSGTVVTIPVLGEVIDPPVGVFTPDDICLNLAQDESTLLIMGVSNNGGENLNWTFVFLGTIPDWLEISTLSGSLAPDATQSVPIIVNATGLSGGTYEYIATIFTNDPIQTEAYLNVKLNVAAPPVANFFPSSQTSCNGVIEFTDASQGGVTSWQWDFGDGNSSEEQNPTHIYNSSGIYDVSLIACNPAGCDTLTLENLINYAENQSLCDTLIMGVVGDTTLFNCSGYIYDSGGPDEDYAESSNYTITINSPNATGILLSFDEFDLENNWDFLSLYAGENTSAPLLGTYTGTDAPGGGSLLVFGDAVTLLFTSDGIIERSGFAMSYSCTSPTAVANFTTSTGNLCSNERTFTNTSLNATTYSWDFGDGNFSDEVSPTHIFSSIGTYFVSLTAENDSGNSVFTEVVEITTLPFDLDITPPNSISVNNPATFSYDCSVNLSEVEWTTSTGNMTSLDNPNFIFFQTGEIEISLTAIDMNGCQVTMSELFFIDELNNLSDNHQISSFKVYPNPTSGVLNIDLSLNENAPIEWTLFNTFGQKLREQKFQSTRSLNEVISLDNLPMGTYYLGIWIDGKFAGHRRIILLE